ncbi:MAG TPA: HAMP domain-containing sensor histidine kinase [Steroidobacteraceae bacterium]|nr:HAMP domain-containing sensor histidine kinase [Steroidobacteraceae bacterium]
MSEISASRVSLLRSAAFRLAVVQAAIFALIVSVLFFITWWSVGAYVEQRVHEIATDGLKKLTRILDASPGADHIEAERDLDENQHYGLFDANGRYLEGDIRIPVSGETNVRTPLGGRGAALVPLHVASGRIADGRRLVVGMDRRKADVLLGRFRRAFLTGGATGIAAALVVGFLTARRYLRRVEQIAAVAAQIDDGRLDTRLTVTDRRDEIDRLSAALNATWQRTESLVEGMRQLSTDVAHELRTPLAHLRFRLEKTRANLDAHSPARAVMDQSLNDVDRVLAVFRALLRISQIQSRQRRAGFETLDLSQLVSAVTADFGPLFEDEGRAVRLYVQNRIHIFGDRTLLEQLLVNLIENALRHTSQGTSVSVGLTQNGAVAELTVSDSGTGIPESQRERVLQRLVRLDTARTSPGMGLGLALVKAIADLHEATLELGDAQPGLCVTIRLPRAA